MEATSMKTDFEREAIRLAKNLPMVSGADVAKMLVAEILVEHVNGIDRTDVAMAGVWQAVNEIDRDTLTFAVDNLCDHVRAEIEGQARAIALRMLQETAANANRDGTEYSAVGGN